MPELPEVQTTVSGLNTVLPRLAIQRVWTNYGGAFHAGKQHIKNREYFPRFVEEVAGKKFLGVRRRGKNILLDLTGGKTILVHMKMTGHLMYGRYRFSAEKKDARDPWKATDPGPLQDPFNAHVRLVFELSNGRHLVLSDMRRFAKITVTDTENLEKHPDLASLGPEPLPNNFTLAAFRERLMKRPFWKAKQVLLAQDIIAGIGNIYSDEILWLGGVRPERRVKDILPAEWKRMFMGMKKVLSEGISLGGDSLSDYRNAFGEKGQFQNFHKAYRQTGKPCPKRGCKGFIKRMKIGGRSAHFCSVHQK